MSDQKFQSAFRILCINQTLIAGGTSLVFPFLAIYFHMDRHIPMGLVGVYFSLVMLATAVSQGLGGEISDIHGRRAVMLGSLWLRSLAVTALAVAIWRKSPVPVILGLHMLSSFVANFFDPAARGWVADHTRPQERARAFGLLRIAVNLGWAIGPALGAWMTRGSYAALFLASSAVSMGCAALVYAFIRDRSGKTRAEAFELRGVLRAGQDRRFLPFCAYNLLIAIVMAQLVVSFSVHATEFMGLSKGQVGLLFSLNGLLVVVFQYPLSIWWSRFRLTTALTAGCLLYGAGYLWMGFAGGFATAALATVVVTLGEIVVSPGLHALAANMAPPDSEGRYLGFAGLMHQIGTALGPLSGGIGLQYLSPVWAPAHWTVMAATALAAATGFGTLSAVLNLREQGVACRREPPMPASPAPAMM